MNANSTKPQVCLVLQGGGALGAYHIGAFQALEEAGYTPDWYAGISIGAINATILAGNPPEKRLEKIEEFWEIVSLPGTGIKLPDTEIPLLNSLDTEFFNSLNVLQSFVLGQPNFFTPRLINPWFAFPGEDATSFYDTAPLYETLKQLVDFDRINQQQVRYTVGATQITDGKLVTFDNKSSKIGPEHPIASGSYPPALPATKVGEGWYWDGGLVSNTPINEILELSDPHTDLLIFVIDLANPRGDLPQSMSEVIWRKKEIENASRAHVSLKNAVDIYNYQHQQNNQAGRKIDVIQTTYEPLDDHTLYSYTNFSRRAIELRKEHGYRDLKQAIHDHPWKNRHSQTCAELHIKDAKSSDWKTVAAQPAVLTTLESVPNPEHSADHNEEAIA